MSTAPTLYFLRIHEVHVPSREGEVNYEVWEQHMCQEPGCFKSQPQLVSFCFKKEEVEALIEDWKINPPLAGKLEDVEWEHIETIPQIEDITSVEAHGVYHNLTELVLAISELSSLKPYKVVNEFGDFAGYTFEVVE